MSWNVELGDCLEVLATLPDCSIDSVVTDPPYELGFMGKKWDSTGIAYSVDLWRQVLRVLKPGGHLLAFSGSRTYHRMAVAIEDAGFDVRDQIMWVYGSGFPKSLDVSKAFDKAAGAERPVIGHWKPTGTARPSKGGSHSCAKTTADCGYIPDNDALIPITAPATDLAKQWHGWGTALKPAHEPIVMARKPLAGTVAQTVQAYGTGAINVDSTRAEGNRWPANLIHDGSQDVVAHFPDGSARFFYCPKAGKADRENGLSDFEVKNAGGLQGRNDGSLGSVTRRANHHPTVKPTDLMRYLCRLVTPPGGKVLDPFTGSGSTGKAAVMEGFSFQGIERDAEYSEIAKARITHAEQKSISNRSGGQCGCGLSGGCGNPICGIPNAGDTGIPTAKFGFGRDFHIGKPGKKLHPEALIQLELPF